MIIDARELPFDETFKELKEVVSHGYASFNEVLIFVDAHDGEKVKLITGFAEILLGCKSRVVETNGYYIVRVNQEHVEGILRG